MAFEISRPLGQIYFRIISLEINVMLHFWRNISYQMLQSFFKSRIFKKKSNYFLNVFLNLHINLILMEILNNEGIKEFLKELEVKMKILLIFQSYYISFFIQVNLCQKHLFLDQLTHNMTKIYLRWFADVLKLEFWISNIT